MSNSEKLDPLEKKCWRLLISDNSSKKEKVFEVRQLEIELANINQFKEEIASFKEYILEEYGLVLEHEFERTPKLRNK